MIWLPLMLITLKTRRSQFVPENTPYNNYWLYLPIRRIILFS